MPMYEILKNQIKTKTVKLFKYKEEEEESAVIWWFLMRTRPSVTFYLASSYLLVGVMELCVCPHRVQEDRSGFAGLVGGIAEKRGACGSVRTWSSGHPLAFLYCGFNSCHLSHTEDEL